MTWQPSALPDRLQQRGGDPALLGKELLWIISDAIANHPRTLQKRIGPSEIGDPCARRIGYKLLQAPRFNDAINWKAFIGTAMHEKLEDVFDRFNLRFAAGDGASPGEERFYLEQKVTAGELNGEDIDGSTDVYDRVTATVIDWKLVGPASLRDKKQHGVGIQYETQAHSYGRGWRRAGLPVDTVMVVCLPRNADLHNAYIWHEPYNEQVAIDGFTRAQAIATTTRATGVAALQLLPTADAHCFHCDFYRAGSTDLRQGCPGDPANQPATAPALTMGGRP